MGYKDMVLYQDMTPTLLFAAVFSSLVSFRPVVLRCQTPADSIQGAFTFGYDNNWWGGVIGSTYVSGVLR
jgi:hypothetical protein